MAAGCWSLRMALEVSDRLQVSHCAAPGVSRQHCGLRVLGYGGSGEPQGLRVLQVSYSGPGISGQLDTEVSMRLQGSQDSPGVSQCLGLGSQEGPKVLGWLQMSYSGPGTLIAAGHWGLRVTPGVSVCSPRALKAALGSHSAWVWGLTWPCGSHGSRATGSQSSPTGLVAIPVS